MPGEIQVRDRVGVAPRDFGASAPPMRKKRLRLDAETSDERVEATGTWLWVPKASSHSAEADVGFNTGAGKLTVRQGSFVRGVRFDHLVIDWAAQSGEWLDVFYGVQELEVVNPATPARVWEAVARSQTFVRRVSQAAVAAEYAKAQLLNPAGSGVQVYVTRLSPFLGTAGEWRLEFEDAALATGPSGGFNKFAGGTASTAKTYRETNAALPTADFGRYGASDFTESPRFLELAEEPIVLDEGKGLLAYATTVNVQLVLNFEWVEVVL